MAALRNAGAWLRECHRLPPLAHTRPRHETRDEFVASIGVFATYLTATVGRRRLFQRVAESVRAAAVDALPAALPLGMSHSDFAPNNIFVGPAGRVTVFDTVGRWQSPIYEDLGHFLVALKAATWRDYGIGAAQRAHGCPWEMPFLVGYFEHRVPLVAVRLFELQAVLVRWAGLADGVRQSASLRRAAKRVRLAWWGRLLGRYAEELLNEIDAPAAAAAGAAREKDLVQMGRG